jgi:undecaprenyl-diphosphatase
MLEQILQWDRSAFIYLNGLGIEPFDTFWLGVTDVLTWTPLYLFFIGLLLWKYPFRDALGMTLTVALLILSITQFTDLTKAYFERLRPNNDGAIDSLIRILRRPEDYSFFSGHASFSFSLTTLIVLFTREKLSWGYLFYIWPLLFAFSRIYVGVHYPLDILIGALVGILAAYLFYRAYRGIIQRSKQ